MRITAPGVRELETFHCKRPQAQACAPGNIHRMAGVTSPKLRLLSDATFRRTFYLVKRLETEAAHALDMALSDYDITSGQYLILSLVSREGGRSSAELARRAFVTPQSMNEVIAALETKGYIRRTENPDNRRILQVGLTREGRRLLAACDKTVDRAEAAFLSVLPPRKLAEFRATMERLLAAARR
jgi:DNA-binding MarR family transcriptional regulator